MKVGHTANFKGATGGRGGKRTGAGRKFGTKEKTTLEREKVQEAFNQRVFRIADNLINAQASIAQGIQVLYKVSRVVKESGKIVEGKPEIVTDLDEISAYINGDLKESKDKYYYMTIKEPQNSALDSLLNRAMGKPKETLELQDATRLKMDI